MGRFLLIPLSLLTGIFLFSFPSSAADAPFNRPANWGGTGLLEIPNARVMEYGRARIGFTQVEPYRCYYGVFSPLPGLEIGGRVTEIIGVKIKGWTRYGYYKDRAIDIKWQFLKEGKYRPAAAIGIMDPTGTRLYAAQYLVFSKQIFPFDFTFGVGNGRFGRRCLGQTEGFKLELFQSPSSWKDVRPFGGVEFAPSKWFSFVFEYNPILYHKHHQDPAQRKYFKSPVPSPFNFGVRIRPFRFLDLTFSYQRGEAFGVNASLNFGLGGSLYPIRYKLYVESEQRKLLSIEERILAALLDMGFSDVGVLKEGDTVYVEFQNESYFYATRAVGIALYTVEALLPPEVKWIDLVYKEEGIPLFRVTVYREDLVDLYAEKLTLGEFLYLSKFDFELTALPRKPRYSRPKRLSYSIKPSFYTYLNDPSGFFKYRAGLEASASYRFMKGTTISAGIGCFPLNNISTRVLPLSIPVRSDIVDYISKKFLLEFLTLEHKHKFSDSIFGYIGVGYLEVQYAGVNAQIGRSFFDGKLMLGLDSSLVFKRDPDVVMGLRDEDYYTILAKARWYTPVEGLSVDLKAGRFLAGDPGVRIQLNKDFNGVVISVWYSFTDTSVFKDPFNRGYHDKGIMISIPLRIFSGKDSRRVAYYALSPWTRDVAQDVVHRELFDFMREGSKFYLDKHIEDIVVE